MKFYVVAGRWVKQKEEIEIYIAGEFESFMNATIFRKAYNEYYSTNAKIFTEYELLTNAFDPSIFEK